MKFGVFAIAMAAIALPAFAQVGVSVNVGEPGFYGQIDIGNAPPPAVVYAQPRIVEPYAVGGPPPPPLYLHVPPGHIRHWRRHCHEYNACGRPVYFVQEDWYNRVYVPHYREHHDHWEDHHGDDRGHDHGRDGDRGHDDRRDHDHGHGDDHGHNQ
jgi:hypothetical protein